MKKLLLAVLTCATALTLAACGNDSKEKFGFIFLHNEKSTYDKNFIDAAKDVCKELGVKALLKTNVEEGEACYNAAKDLVNKGCKGVFADSFGHEPYMIQAAKEFPNVQFAHATGTQAHTESLTNFHNAFASIYEGRYVAGIAAGMKINDMIAKSNGTLTTDDAIMGYVGAFPYAEVISGYTSFYLGAKSVCPEVKMTVRFTNSWYDENAESATCKTLIEEDKAILISQHADSQGAPTICENKNVPNVFYNGKNDSLDSYLTSSRINWRPHCKYFIQSTLEGKTMETDWTGTLENGAVEVYPVNTKLAAEGTQDAMNKAIKDLKEGKIKVFDTNNFTVDGEHLTSYMADVDDFGKADGYAKDTEVISDGYFKESIFRSAPYFDITIDGITKIIKSEDNE